ncbi:hypothetical protein RJ639_045299 [Escallonia herrerae]|uniref:Glucan endo-1,3-beta-D-glucosidase n=1 Tax=Escallonia herrerae TaxID=1293975 RepID=A0AA88W496_9ASTE|nr:hypothetical protein RJ639_045299 [Escallonia herrerae]
MNAQIGISETKIGVCYGMKGNDLPSYADVIGLYKKYSISNVRLFDPSPDALNALKGQEIAVVLGVLNSDIPNLAGSQDFADQWVTNFITPYKNDIPFSYISVGNEVIPGEYATNVAPAMQNIQNTLDKQGITTIKVTTVLSSAALANSYPPSATTFAPEAHESMVQVLSFLAAHESPLMINVYPYFAYASDPVNVHLDYAQFTASGPVVVDGSLSYQNLFDAIVDGVYWAMEKEGKSDVAVVVSETGWPSAGNGQYTSPELAATYNKNFVQHISANGTPKRPNALIEGFIFAMFNENLKPEGVEQNFGLFYPNMEPVYSVFPPPGQLYQVGGKAPKNH